MIIIKCVKMRITSKLTPVRKRERDEKGKIKLTKINEIEGIRAA